MFALTLPHLRATCSVPNVLQTADADFPSRPDPAPHAVLHMVESSFPLCVLTWYRCCAQVCLEGDVPAQRYMGCRVVIKRTAAGYFRGAFVAGRGMPVAARTALAGKRVIKWRREDGVGQGGADEVVLTLTVSDR
jgi:hypothetical protein